MNVLIVEDGLSRLMIIVMMLLFWISTFRIVMVSGYQKPFVAVKLKRILLFPVASTTDKVVALRSGVDG